MINKQSTRLISETEVSISNPVCSPSFRSSPSNPFSSSAFATGGPLEIIAFYRSLQNTLDASRSLDIQYLKHVDLLSASISPKTYTSGYERFRPNNRDCHSWRRCYRGGWHPSYPPLIRQPIYSWQKPMLSISTGSSLIALPYIVKVSRLLHPVGLGSVSQYPSPGSPSQGPY